MITLNFHKNPVLFHLSRKYIFGKTTVGEDEGWDQDEVC